MERKPWDVCFHPLHSAWKELPSEEKESSTVTSQYTVGGIKIQAYTRQLTLWSS